ncbi:hypothetical protein HP548_19215 [Paenibacillus taichungensis]|uniref:Uncharacterized protein n=1 Tax=Paenibacillus taichungensis TaxID=484184 RepID=A0ABX2MQ98_9BACL|nr:hypothetical protein [Paenibacillus taichungensis]
MKNTTLVNIKGGNHGQFGSDVMQKGVRACLRLQD